MSKKILLIDDEEETVQILQKQVQKAGYEVAIAHNGKEALNVARQFHPHLILTDIAMPVMNGMVFCNEVKLRKDLNHIPIMVASAYGANERAMRDLGCKDFLVKPFDKEALINKVNEYFNNTKARSILIATKMQRLMGGILADSSVKDGKIEVAVLNDPNSLVETARTISPQVILLDVDMFIAPSAGEMVRLLREQDILKETHILVMRSMQVEFSLGGGLNSKPVVVDQCLANGATQYIGHMNAQAFSGIINDYC